MHADEQRRRDHEQRHWSGVACRPKTIGIAICKIARKIAGRAVKANSSDARSAIEAPKLAITIEMAAPLPRSRLNRMRSSASARPPVSAIATSEAAITASRRRAPRCPRSAPVSAEIPRRYEQRRIGAAGDELAMGEIGEAQDRIGERHADRAEADQRAGDQPVDKNCGVTARLPFDAAEIERRDHRIARQRPRRTLVPVAALHQHIGAVGERQRGARVLLDEQDRDAGLADVRELCEDRLDQFRRQPGRRLVEHQKPGRRSARGRSRASAAGRPKGGRPARRAGARDRGRWRRPRRSGRAKRSRQRCRRRASDCRRR